MNKKFENIIKQKVDESEFAFDPADWNALKKQLPNQKAPWYKSSFTKGIAALIIIGSASFYFINYNNNDAETITETKETKSTVPYVEEVKKSNNQTKDAEKVKVTETISKINNEEKVVSDEVNNSKAIENEALNDIEQKNVELATNEGENSQDLVIDNTITKIDEESEPLKVATEGLSCIGESLELTTNQNGNHQWKLNGQIIDSKSNKIKVEFNESNSYHIQLNSDNYSWDTTIEINGLSEPLDFGYIDSKDPYIDEAAELYSNYKGEGQYIWNITGIEGEIIGNPINIEFGKEGIFNVELLYRDAKGCEFLSEKTVDIKTDFDPLAPNSYTPDGDGLNETFIPKGFENVEYESLKFYIFDSKNQLIYTSNSLDEPWNGRVNNSGEKLKGEYFVWRIDIRNKTREKTFTGKAKIYSF